MSQTRLRLGISPELSIAAVGERIRTGELSCVDLLERCFVAIDEWEPKLTAWVSLDRDAALTVARERDVELSQGIDRGPLHGIPIGIKDIFDVAGLATAAGVAFLEDAVAEKDCPIVATLRTAGAVFPGKTVTTQFACFDPPPTRNPWKLDHTPGGSSSGSAAAVATGMCLAALGSQTGGSITRPAAFCGVLGCKPTHGTVRLEGVTPVSASLDHPGPIARCVSDLAILLDCISGSQNVLFDACSTVAAPPRLGVPRGIFAERCSEEGWHALREFTEEGESAGATVIDVKLPNGFDNVLEHHRTVMAFEAAQVHRDWFDKHSDDYDKSMRGFVEEGRRISDSAYNAAKTVQQELSKAVAACFKDADALVTPAATGPAPDTSTTGDPAMNSPWSFTGLPTVSMPIALSDSGLPMGIQLVGRRSGESELFQTAAWCENVSDEGHD